MADTSTSEDPTERRRLDAVHRYAILDTPPDGTFDRITAMAARLCSVPISIVSLVDHDRIWFKSHHGLEVKQIGRDPGLCASAILQDGPWVIGDAKADLRTLANPLVAGAFGLRFYVGVPLRTHDGFNLGTLCVIDCEPRAITEQQVELLSDLATLVMDQMELRLAARTALQQKDLALDQAKILHQEIDHRVMNSLQLVSSLLALQSRSADGIEAQGELESAARRVAAVAQIHRHLYQDEGERSTPGLSYLQRLCSGLADLLALQSLVVEGREAAIPAKHIVPLGLITHELVTNAIKHGGQRVVVSFNPQDAGGYAVRVADDGPGVPADFVPTGSSGLGMKVVQALTRQIHGHLTNEPGLNGQGVSFQVLVPA